VNKRLVKILVMVIYIQGIIGCSCNGDMVNRGGDVTEGVVDSSGVRYCNGETGRYPAWDGECRGNVGCSSKEMMIRDGGCQCTLCRGEECVRIGCNNIGIRDGGEDSYDAGCDLDIRIYPDIAPPDCEFVPDLEGEAVDIDLSKPVIYIGDYGNAWINESNDILVCDRIVNNHCRGIYYIDLDEDPIRKRKVPTCIEDGRAYVWEFSLCNGRNKILFPLLIYTGIDFYEMGLVEYDKGTGVVTRIKTPTGFYSAKAFECQNDDIFIYKDDPFYIDCNGKKHYPSNYFYFNRKKNIHKELNLPRKEQCDDEGCVYWPLINSSITVWGEYAIYTNPLWEEDRYKAEHCIWRYNIDTDEREAFFCIDDWEDTWYPASNVSEYRIVMTIYSRATGYERGILVINFKTGEVKNYAWGSISPDVMLFKNLMFYRSLEEGMPYIYDFDTGVRRRIEVNDEIKAEYMDYILNAGRMNGKYLLTMRIGSRWYLVDMEKLGVIKDGHVVPE